MNIRRTTPADLPAIERLYEAARAALRDMGVDQWQTGNYPSAKDAEADMTAGTSYVLEDAGEVLGVACIAFGREPTYEAVFEGGWEASPAEYGFLHRIAIAPRAKGKNAAGLFFDELKRQARERKIAVLRCDTHRDNLPMQHTLQKNGFVRRGVIFVEDGSERLAFEQILKD
ncbi:N-acetyltransferase family protein [uncultured Neglectibacter sp.]|uniref:GNAT family N-acetyltransferase n=1 Tax=uncultured Neglectibacter sp. TaxID=1924108 RepID=UPI0034DFE0A6